MRKVASALLFIIGWLALSSSATSTVPKAVDSSSLPWISLLKDSDGRHWVEYDKKDANAEAWAQYNESLYDLGWDFVRVEIPELKMTYTWHAYYSAGYLEGYLTANRTAEMTNNFTSNGLSSDVVQWIETHISYMKNMSSANKSPFGNSYWTQVGALLQQIEGMTDGYNAATQSNISMLDMFLLSFDPEIGDVQIAVKVNSGIIPPGTMLDRKHPEAHCSALIKFTQDDLFMAHDTWNSFDGLAFRQYKVYTFLSTITMSATVGSIASGDDWYMTSNELAVQETTDVVWNTSLYTAVVPETVSEFLRVMTANYMATSGEDWTGYFSRHNSGTYNNQWMVVDMKLFVPGATLVPGTLWIAEQIPGFIDRQDVTAVLQKDGYWASYNIPYSKYIFKVSGYTEHVANVGTFWSYDKYARPEIFHRNNTHIQDLAGMMRMMRYNNYKYDPLSIIPNCTGATNNQCNPRHSSMLSIASRGDLLKVYSTDAENLAHYGPLYKWVAQGCFGATDSKIASYKNRRSLTGYIINGPTNDQQPTFRWGEKGVCDVPVPKGSPAVFDFPWLEIKI